MPSRCVLVDRQEVVAVALDLQFAEHAWVARIGEIDDVERIGLAEGDEIGPRSPTKREGVELLAGLADRRGAAARFGNSAIRTSAPSPSGSSTLRLIGLTLASLPKVSLTVRHAQHAPPVRSFERAS